MDGSAEDSIVESESAGGDQTPKPMVFYGCDERDAQACQQMTVIEGNLHIVLHVLEKRISEHTMRTSTRITVAVVGIRARAGLEFNMDVLREMQSKKWWTMDLYRHLPRLVGFQAWRMALLHFVKAHPKYGANLALLARVQRADDETQFLFGRCDQQGKESRGIVPMLEFVAGFPESAHGLPLHVERGHCVEGLVMQKNWITCFFRMFLAVGSADILSHHLQSMGAEDVERVLNGGYDVVNGNDRLDVDAPRCADVDEADSRGVAPQADDEEQAERGEAPRRGDEAPRGHSTGPSPHDLERRADIEDGAVGMCQLRVHDASGATRSVHVIECSSVSYFVVRELQDFLYGQDGAAQIGDLPFDLDICTRDVTRDERLQPIFDAARTIPCKSRWVRLLRTSNLHRRAPAETRDSEHWRHLLSKALEKRAIHAAADGKSARRRSGESTAALQLLRLQSGERDGATSTTQATRSRGAGDIRHEARLDAAGGVPEFEALQTDHLEVAVGGGAASASICDEYFENGVCVGSVQRCAWIDEQLCGLAHSAKRQRNVL